jgi:hypothetical protein
MRWFKNLKKWQQGGLIGCAVGLFFACIIILSPHTLVEWIANFHTIFFILVAILLSGLDLSEMSLVSGVLAAIVIFYGVLGILVGRVQQMANPFGKWLLTALLALFLLFIYWLSFQMVISLYD